VLCRSDQEAAVVVNSDIPVSRSPRSALGDKHSTPAPPKALAPRLSAYSATAYTSIQ